MKTGAKQTRSFTKNARFRDNKKGEMAKVALQLPELASDIDDLVRKEYHMQMWGTLVFDYFVRAVTNVKMKHQVNMRAPIILHDALDVSIHMEVTCRPTETQLQTQRRRRSHNCVRLLG